MPGEQVRKQPHHDFAVFQHVGDAGRRARVVLENEEFIRIGADDIDPGDVDIDVVGDVLAVHLRPEDAVLEDQVVRNDVGPEDVAAVIDVAQEHVERADALFQALFQKRPFLRRHDPRDHVERDQPFGRLGVAIDREGDADPPEQQFRFLPPVGQRLRRGVLEPARQFVIGGANVTAGAVHLVKSDCHKSRLFSINNAMSYDNADGTRR